VKKPIREKPQKAKADEFEAVAERLGCDMDDVTFRKHLGEIAPKKAAPPPAKRKR